ncbi:hypothetical protein RSOLAG1IB_02197 [Rhizoctonia solani AG-1 IB]|uniref:DUF2423 domain-containing protein n=1 Tax=Thanatephorus cucumeris (strain AG1-IB / isolate 7/3/14) TaxID=1108050 RepID=A0A0B7FMQ9_THACB|nr:hypothetical protein RSOLAG1IB_02197 [Rhizoctonia solani AG-1 IB]
MAKSMRSKSKRAFRRTKREEGVYAAVHAARLERLSSKLAAKVSADKDGDQNMNQGEDAEGEQVEDIGEDTAMSGEADEGEGSTAPKKISTSGPRGSRREEWRKSKGLPARSKGGNRMNKHGVIASSKRSGRTKRRR